MKSLLIGSKRPALISLFTLTLCTSLMLGSGMSSQLPASQAELKQAIQQLATEDVENNIERRPSFAQKQYINSPHGLSEAEIELIYDQAYTEAEKAKKTDILGRLSENGLFIPLLLLIGAALGKLFEETLFTNIKKLIKACNDWIYARFAGNRLFRNIALRRYRAALLNKYKAIKIPFRKNKEPLLMTDVYVPLKVEGRSQHQLENIYTAISEHQRLMVKGPPGSGKSMLLKDIAFVYGDNRLTTIPGWPVPVLLELHRLQDAKLSQDKLIDTLAEVFKRNDFPGAKKFVRQGLANGSLLLLLDGLDEVESSIRTDISQSISDLLDTYEHCRVVITCRTAVYQNEFSAITNQTLEVVEFSDQQIYQFLKAWQSEIPPEKSIYKLIQKLQKSPRILALARNPLMLTIIAYLYSKPGFELPNSRTDFYEKATNILLEQSEYKGLDGHKRYDVYEVNTKRTILEELALKHQVSLKQNDRRSISYKSVLKQIKEILPNIDLNAEEHTRPVLQEISERSGLFIQIDKGNNYQFSHLTLQEYFVAAALKQNPEQLFNYFQSDPNAWREVVKLWCGLEVDCTDLIQKVYAKHSLTGFECLVDAKKITHTVAESIIEDFTKQIYTHPYSETLASAYGAMAADTRYRRGQKVFSFLERCLDADNRKPAYKTAVNALAIANSSEAVSVLTERYNDSSHIREALVRMGDLAVLPLANLLEQETLSEKLSVIDALYAIGTPNAAKKLVKVLWNKDISIACRAAWALAALLPKIEIEESLHSYSSLPENMVEEERYDWIWQPFGSLQSSLAIIASRIASLLAKDYPNTTPIAPYTTLDPRIILPVCTIINPLDSAKLPAALPDQTNTLLEQKNITLDIEKQIHKILAPVLDNISEASRWKQLLTSLKPELQLDTINRLINTSEKKIEPSHWKNIFKKISYRFQTNWHYRCILIISLAFSMLAIVGMIIFATLLPSQPTIISLLGISTISMVTFWATLWIQDKEQPLASKYFLQLGPLGIVTFIKEIKRYWTYQTTWIGIKAIQETQTQKLALLARAIGSAVAIAGISTGIAIIVSNTIANSIIAFLIIVVVIIIGLNSFVKTILNANAGAGTVVVVSASAIAGISAGIGDITIAIAIVGSIVGTFANAAVSAFVGTGTIAAIGAVIVTATIAVISADAGASTFANAVAIAGAVSIGLNAWKTNQQSTNQKIRQAPLVLLSFPYFCWLPVTCFFAGVAIQSVSTLQTAILLDLIFTLVCLWLWHEGQRREAQALNPFQGGLLETTLQRYINRAGMTAQ